MTRTDTAAWLLAHDHYRILTHRNPDGDTIGCAAALCRGLRSLGKDASIYENPQFTARYDQWLSGLIACDAGGEHTIISVDMASESLLPDNAAQFAGKIQLAMDHHGSNTGFAACTCVEPDLAACGELIYALLLEMGVAITPAMAEAIYLAVATDTGCFQYANTTSNTLRVAAEVKDAGCEAYPINKIFFGTKSVSRLQLEARLTESLEVYGGGKVAVCHVPLSWMDELHLTEDQLDSIASFPRNVEGVEVGAILREQKGNRQKISLRTGESANASAICAHLGGGGHKAAAGATVEGTYEEIRDRLLQAMRLEGVEV